LVERVDLLFDQGEVVQRVEHEVLAIVGTRMPPVRPDAREASYVRNWAVAGGVGGEKLL
jgi:hypothetical protein